MNLKLNSGKTFFRSSLNFLYFGLKENVDHSHFSPSTVQELLQSSRFYKNRALISSEERVF